MALTFNKLLLRKDFIKAFADVVLFDRRALISVTGVWLLKQLVNRFGHISEFLLS